MPHFEALQLDATTGCPNGQDVDRFGGVVGDEFDRSPWGCEPFPGSSWQRDAVFVTKADKDRAFGRAADAAGLVVRDDGDIEAALKSADKVVVGEYYLPHLAHASMEPPVATANFADGKVEVWAPVQSPGGTREDLAKTLDIPIENVTVNVTLLGGGFGRKSKCDFALEAALLSRAVGAPGKVQWTREDDLRHDFLHTVSAERIEAGLDKNGKVIPASSCLEKSLSRARRLICFFS